MRSLWRVFRPASSPAAPAASSLRSQIRHIADARPFQAGDSVLLRKTFDHDARPIFIPRLVPGKEIDRGSGLVSHNSIIGTRVRENVSSSPKESARKGKRSNVPTQYRVHHATLADYVRLTTRLVTPIYPHDAELIVSLFDLHPDALGEDETTSATDGINLGGLEGNAESPSKLEILEAGTGHGAFTLYLSRAIHAANPPFSSADVERHEGDRRAALTEWKTRRRAIVHSVEKSTRYAKAAKDTVKGFRGGMYARNVKFYNQDVGAWIAESMSIRGNSPFLSHAFLDLPNSDLQVPDVAKVLRTDGTLIIFCPSITQITQAASLIREKEVPLELERVIELGVNGGAGGREWDVRRVKPRALVKEAKDRSVEGGTSAEEEDVADDSSDLASRTAEVDTSRREGEASASERLVERTLDGEPAEADESEMRDPEASSRPDSTRSGKDGNRGWTFVCRPKVGDRITGGGFLGVWKKARYHTE